MRNAKKKPKSESETDLNVSFNSIQSSNLPVCNATCVECCLEMAKCKQGTMFRWSPSWCLVVFFFLVIDSTRFFLTRRRPWPVCSRGRTGIAGEPWPCMPRPSSPGWTRRPWWSRCSPAHKEKQRKRGKKKWGSYSGCGELEGGPRGGTSVSRLSLLLFILAAQRRGKKMQWPYWPEHKTTPNMKWPRI